MKRSFSTGQESSNSTGDIIIEIPAPTPNTTDLRSHIAACIQYSNLTTKLSDGKYSMYLTSCKSVNVDAGCFFFRIDRI